MAWPGLGGLAVVVDVQHLYRDGRHRGDRGSIYRLQGGGKLVEADLALHYAQVACERLQALGARVYTNDPAHGILTGPYSRRQATAMGLSAGLYLACHVNAGGGRYALVEFVEPPAMASFTTTNPRSSREREAARALADSFAHLPGIRDGRIAALEPGARGRVCVAGFTRGPALILEPFFGDCPEHQGLTTLAGLEVVGRAVAQGVLAWYKPHPTP